MKKSNVWFKIILLVIIASLVLVGCSTENSQEIESEDTIVNDANDAQKEKSEGIIANFVTANVGGNMHIIGGALGEQIEASVPGSSITVQPGESGGNPIVLNDGNADIGTTMYGNAAASFAGKSPYNEKVTNVSALANLNIRQWIAFISSNKEYTTLKDMINDKYPIRLVLGSPGSSSETLIRYILEEYGVTYDDIKSWGGTVTHVSHADAVGLVKDNHADVYASIPSLQFPAVVDLTTSKDVVFLELDKDVIDNVAKNKDLLTGELPAGTYDGQPNDYYSLMESQLLICRTDGLTDEQAYEIVRILNEKKEELVSAHSDMSNFDIEVAPFNTGLPLHPGAEKYYKEIDVLK